ncbi:MAG TPA: type II secretion system protein [Pyrinomonadaceae bacterium]|nr:type II secretion system protein [Pyrinomonadaceae bacterium]
MFRRKNKNFRLSTFGSRPSDGFTLLELIITLTVLAVMVLATLPLAQNSVKRQREQQLREALREIRLAIDEFKRDTYGACPQGAISSKNRIDQQPNIPTDPRSRVVIDDCTIFTTENVDRYPPTLEVLAEGVKVKARGLNVQQGGAFDDKNSIVFNDSSKDLKKVYLREIPIDPITGKADWRLRSSYQEKGAGAWDDVNVFDVRSNSDAEALNGEKYSDW